LARAAPDGGRGARPASNSDTLEEAAAIARVEPDQAADRPSGSENPTATVSSAVSPRAGTKIAGVTNMLSRAEGATIDELASAMGWLPHTTRAALTGLRKRGYALISDRSDKARGSIYRVAAAQTAGPSIGLAAVDVPTVGDSEAGANPALGSHNRRRTPATVANATQSCEAP
jgi:hypothetical protein